MGLRRRTRRWARGLLYGLFLLVLPLLYFPAAATAGILLSSSAQGGTVTVRIQTPELVLVNSSFVARVAVSQVDNFDAANYVVTFNQNVLAATDVRAGSIGGTAIPVGAKNIDNATGRVIVVQNVPGLAGISGTGSLAEIHFRVVGSAGQTSPIGLESGVLGDNSANAIPAEWIGASVTVTPHQVATVSIDAPDRVFVDSNFISLIRINEVTNFDAANYDVVFDPNVLRTADVSAGQIDGKVIPVDAWTEVAPGRIRIVQNVPGTDGASGSGYLAAVSFLVVGEEGATGDITLEDVALGDTQSRPIPSKTAGHTVLVTVPVEPLLCTSPYPPSFNFGELARGDVQQKTFELTNCGTGTLEWTVSAGQPWISLSPGQGTATGETDSVVVTVDTSTLQGGLTHTGTVTVSSNGGSVKGTISVSVVALPVDLTVSDISITPSSFQDGDTVTVVATIENIGTGAVVEDFQVAFKVGQVKIGSQRVRSGVAAGEQVQVTQVWGVSPGAHTVTVIADELGAIGESDETNNERAKALPVVPFPDLVVAELSWSPQASIDHGAEVTFVATVANQGEGGTSRGFQAFFELDGAFIGQSTVRGVSAGGSVQVSQTWTATLGDHNVRAFADRFDVVPESIEGNNDLVESLPSVVAPDLLISEITTSPLENLVDGQQVAIAATVTNAGSGDLPGSFLVRFEIDGAFLAQELVSGGLSTGGSVVFSTDWTAQVGAHSVRAIADSGGGVTESNEGNNSLTQPLPEVPASDLVPMDVAFAPAQGVSDGEEMTITARIANTGDGDTLRDFSVLFEVDGVPIGSQLVTGGLATGGQLGVSQVWTSVAGVHTARVVVDETNAVTESEEGNNQLTVQMPEVVAPDLIVAEVTWLPAARFSDGEGIPVSATVRNIGSGDTLRDFSVRFEVDDVFIGSHVVTGGLASGQSKVAFQVWTAQVGIHRLRATVDETDTVKETDEDNNTLSSTLPNVPASDLVVTSIAWVPATGIDEGEQVTFTATVKNISANDTSRGFDVRFEIDNVFIGRARIAGGLRAGEEKQTTQTWTSRVGIHEVKAIADPGRQVTESNESNNEKLETLPEVKVPGLDLFEVTGQVILQGRIDHSKTLVTFAHIASGDVYKVATDAGGNFSIDLPSGTHEVVASHPGYLSARMLDVVIGAQQPNALPPVTLAGGDVDGDADVDFRDLRLISRGLNTADTPSDVNGDGLVDIQDLAIAASNFGKRETLWPASSQ